AALVTLNDPVFTEAAQAVARRVVEEAGVGAKQRAAFAWQLITARRPVEGEASRILQLFEEQLVHYRQHKDAAHKMATNPLGPLPDGADVAEMAAWTVVASVLPNLDETLSRG
ncbi:MAG: DUF1553 domain-containing protein, partial [Pirellulales bacterium]